MLSAQVPFGETENQVCALIREAVELSLAALEEHGERISVTQASELIEI